MVRLLCEHGAEPNARDDDGMTTQGLTQCTHSHCIQC